MNKLKELINKFSKGRFFKKPLHPIWKLIHDKGKCCISGRPLNTCRNINVIQIPFVCTWGFPYWKPLPAPRNYKNLKFAIAYVHDEEIGKLSLDSVKYAVEIINKNKIIYHEVSKLQKDPFIFKDIQSPFKPFDYV